MQVLLLPVTLPLLEVVAALVRLQRM